MKKRVTRTEQDALRDMVEVFQRKVASRIICDAKANDVVVMNGFLLGISALADALVETLEAYTGDVRE